MRFLQVIVLPTLLIFLTSISLAQNAFLPDLEPISATNLEQLNQIAMFHRGTIEEMSWSPNSQYLAVGGSAGGWIYNAANLQAEPIHFARFMSVRDLDFHPSSDRIISTGNDGAVYEWDSVTGGLIREIAPIEYNECPFCKADIMTVKYSTDGRYIAIGSSNANTLLLDSSTFSVLASIPENSYELFFSPNGRYIAAKEGMRGNLTLIWSVDSLISGETQALHIINELPIETWNIAWTADSENLLIADMLSEHLYKYHLATRTFSELSEGSAIVTANSDYIAIAHAEYDFHSQEWFRYSELLEPNTGEIIQRFDIFMWVTDLRFSPDGDYLAIASPDGSIQIWDIKQGRLLDNVIGTGAMITDIALLSDQYLLSMETESYAVDTAASGGACGENTLRLWDLNSATEINQWRSQDPGFQNFVCGSLASLPNSQQILLQDAAKELANIIVLNPFTQEFFHLTMPFANERPYHDFQFQLSNDGSRLAVLANSYTDEDEIFVWDVSDGLNRQSQAIQTIAPYAGSIHDLVFSPNNLELIIAFDTGELSRWAVETGELLSQIDWEIPRWFNTLQLAISPDNSKLALNPNTGLYFFETTNYSLMDIWEDEEFGVGDEILYGRSNEWFVTRENYNSYRFWRTEANSSYYLPVVAEEIAFSDDGRFFVTGGTDGAIRIWGIAAE